MSTAVEITETPTHVFEFSMTPDTPGHCRRVVKVRVLSGAPLTAEQWGRAAEAMTRSLIDAGDRVLKVTFSFEEDAA